MAALRKRRIAVITYNIARDRLRFLKRKKRKLKGGRGITLKGIRRVPIRVMYEIVATTPQEVDTGMFEAIGDAYVFKPELGMERLWDRIRFMNLPENIEVWAHPHLGIKRAFIHMKWELPKLTITTKAGETKIIPPYHLIKEWPASLLTEARERTVRLPARAGERVRMERVRYYPYEEFIKSIWIPKFLFNESRFPPKGLFPSINFSKSIASIFDITLDLDARKAQWLRPAVPQPQKDAEREIQLDEGAYQTIKQFIISEMEKRVAEGQTAEIDWHRELTRYLEPIFGAKSGEVLERLRQEIKPVRP